MRAFKEGDKLKFVKITNDDLVCRDCIYRLNDNTSECEWYDVKPSKVLNGGKCSMHDNS